MENILITGVAGFIGSHLADFFIKKNFFVTGIDNLLTGSTKNIIHLFDNKNFKFFELDVCSKITIKNEFKYILHLASPASPKDYLNYPIKTLETGSNGTLNILNFALENKSTILLASTSEVYGDPEIHPQNENYNGNVSTIGPRSVYDEAKRFLEAAGVAFLNKHNLDVKIIRIFNTYGPRMKVNDGRAIPNLINQAINGKKLSIFGDGNQTRSFCYIDDLIEGIFRLLTSNVNIPINIGNPNEISILDLSQIIKRIVNSNSEITYKPLPKDDPKKRKPDIKRAKNLLNWEPSTSLEDGLLKTVNYYYNIKNEEN